MKLERQILYWYELPGRRPQDFVRRDIPVENRRLLAQVLAAGIQLEAWCGYADCRICGAQLGSCDFGGYNCVWPEKAEHYILEHDVWTPGCTMLLATVRGRGQEQVGERGVPSPTTYTVVRDLLLCLPEAQSKVCLQLLDKHAGRIKSAPGSTHNHQAWRGGYVDHVAEVMTLATVFYGTFTEKIDRPLPFTLEDALVVLFLHDVEKPWRIVEHEGGYGHAFTKDEVDAFREKLLQEHSIWGTLTEAQREALKYVEGEKDRYTPGRRMMSELAAFCHLCDVTSARIFWDYPKREAAR